MSIDKFDSGNQTESKFSALRSLLLEELNHLNDFIIDLGFDDYSDHRLE